MKNLAFVLGRLVLAITLTVDIGIFFNGMKVLGIFSLISSLLVFAAGMVWLIYRDDGRVYFKRKSLFIPITLFGLSIVAALREIPIDFKVTNENLEEVGNLLMSRYQMALFIVSVLVFFVFVIASSLLSSERRG